MTEITENQRKKIVKVELLETFAELVDNLYGSPMGASGINHAPGLVPDPGETAGTSKFLCEDGTWKLPEGESILAKIRVNLEEYIDGSKQTGTILNGITVTVQNTTIMSEPNTKVWQGEELVFENLTPLKNYRVAVQSISGYKVNYEYQDVVNIDLLGDVAKTFKYEATRYTATMTSNQDVSGTLDSNIDRSSSGVYLVAQYTYGGNTITSGQLHYGDTLLMPTDVDISTIQITGSSVVSGYKKVTSINHTNKTLIISYTQTVYTGYIIIDDTTNAPDQKIIDENNKTYTSGYTRPKVINTIRNLSHCYVQLSFDNNVLSIKQLDDTNATRYVDGTSAATDITTKNVFMRLPEFYTRTTSIATNKNRIEFWIDTEQNSSPGTGWTKWGGNDLIGRYKAKMETISSSNFLRSFSGTATGGLNRDDAKTYARNNGYGFSITCFRHHCIMAVLFFAYYGTTNSQTVCGKGGYTGSSSYTVGTKNALGMTDTTTANGNSGNTLFWGLEDWWGNYYEFVDDVTYNGKTTLSLFDYNGNAKKTITVTKFSANNNVFISKMKLGSDLIMFPSEIAGTSTTGYCDGFRYSTVSFTTYRSGRNEDDAGVAFLWFYPINGYYMGARLCYQGNITIV